MQVLHFTKHGFYELYTDVLWLMSLSSDKVLPIKQSDKDMNDKRLTKSYKSHKRATKLTLLSCAWECSSKLQEIKSWETLFQRPSKVHKYHYTHTQPVFVFFKFSLFLINKNKLNKTTNNHAWEQEGDRITWNLFPSRQEVWMDKLSFA